MPDLPGGQRALDAQATVEDLLEDLDLEWVFVESEGGHVVFDGERNGAIVGVDASGDDLVVSVCAPLVSDVGEADAQRWRALCGLNDRSPLVKFTYREAPSRISARAELLVDALNVATLSAALRAVWRAAADCAPSLATEFHGRPVSLWQRR